MSFFLPPRPEAPIPDVKPGAPRLPGPIPTPFDPTARTYQDFDRFGTGKTMAAPRAPGVSPFGQTEPAPRSVGSSIADALAKLVANWSD